MLNEHTADFEHDMMNGRYCIECECELDGEVPMHMRFCDKCAESNDIDVKELGEYAANCLEEWNVKTT